MRVVTDRDSCVSSGQCVFIEPAVFDQSDEDGTVVLLTEHVDGDQLATVREAVNDCPGQALSLAQEEPDGTRVGH